MVGKTALVTGATSGIGTETAVGLAKLGARVVITGRDPARTQAALDDIRRRSGRSDVEALACDFSSLASIRALAAQVRDRYGGLSVLVNNAGGVNTSFQKSRDGFELTFAVNHLGYFLLTTELLELLKKNAPARIVSVASRAHQRGHMQFDDLMFERRRYSAWAAYGQSKLANVMFTYELSRRLKDTGVTANCLHPGVVATGFGAGKGLLAVGWKIIRPFLITAEEGAKTSIYLASSAEVEGVSGKYFSECRERSSSPESYDEVAQRRLWQVSEQLVGAAAKAA